MAELYQYTLWLHAAAGLMGLALFWIPIAVRKGGPRHKRIGKYYLHLMLISGFSGLIMAALLMIDPIAVKFPNADYTPERLNATAAAFRDRAWFFFLLAALVIATAQRAKLSLVARGKREALRTPTALAAPIALLVTSLVVGGLAILKQSALFGGFAGLGVFVGSGLLWYAFKPTLQPREWVIEHLSSAIASGIAAHTAFLVFGAAQLFGEVFRGSYALVPWFAPGVIGGVAITILTRQYRRRFGHVGERAGTNPA